MKKHRPRPAIGYMVYLLIDPRDRVPFYVGITCRPTARWAHHQRNSGAAPRLAELIGLKLKCRVRILASNLSWFDARDRETALIAAHQETLVNKLRYQRRDTSSRRNPDHRDGAALSVRIGAR